MTDEQIRKDEHHASRITEKLGYGYFLAVNGWQKSFPCPKCGKNKLDISNKVLGHPIICTSCKTMFDLLEVKKKELEKTQRG